MLARHFLNGVLGNSTKAAKRLVKLRLCFLILTLGCQCFGGLINPVRFIEKKRFSIQKMDASDKGNCVEEANDKDTCVDEAGNEKNCDEESSIQKTCDMDAG